MGPTTRGQREPDPETPVAVPPLEELAALSAEALARYDPLVLNLVVARGCPPLAGLDVAPYAGLVDGWAAEIETALNAAETQFHLSPGDWRDDLGFFRLGILCWFVDERLGIRYRDDQRDARQVAYTDPSDLFLSGVIDTRQGTCANMPALHVALAWRLGWPLFLAVAGWHVLCRSDDGLRVHNIEATNTGGGGFHAHPDDYYRQNYSISEEAVALGSDLTPLDARQMLGLFVGFRARFWQDDGHPTEAAIDYRLACRLFPNSVLLRRKASEVLGPGALETETALTTAGTPTHGHSVILRDRRKSLE